MCYLTSCLLTFFMNPLIFNIVSRRALNISSFPWTLLASMRFYWKSRQNSESICTKRYYTQWKRVIIWNLSMVSVGVGGIEFMPKSMEHSRITMESLQFTIYFLLCAAVQRLQMKPIWTIATKKDYKAFMLRWIDIPLAHHNV